MKQFDIYRNPNPRTARRTPYLLILQSDFLSVVDTVVVGPLASAARTTAIARLNPIIDVSGSDHVLLTQEMAALPRPLLTRPVGSAALRREEIVVAMDLVFFGF